ncbi:hypothetical protein [Streptomyces sp. 1222.5]|uniref:hypothetical protein n=1 Tax=Streptomyces sp. 1222.5 TaxID=1881026 RepID=UPI003EBD6FE8
MAKISRRVGRALIGLGSTAAIMCSFMASPASAATVISSSLSINNTPAPGGVLFINNYDMHVSVWVPMTQTDAAGYMWNGASVTVDTWGQDTFANDFLAGPKIFNLSSSQLHVESDGIHVDAIIQASCSVLDEDGAPLDNDEIFVKAKFIDGDGATIKTSSNVVKNRNFGCY